MKVSPRTLIIPLLILLFIQGGKITSATAANPQALFAQPSPPIAAAQSATALAAGDKHTCALTTTGGVQCWGRNDRGQLGDGTIIDRAAPVDVSGLISGVRAVSSGGTHTCALTTTGGVQCWGRNDKGQLGDGTTTDSHIPVTVDGLASGVDAIATGGTHTCALTDAGGVLCWGSNEEGQLGDNTVNPRPNPVQVTDLASGVKAIGAGLKHTCALTTGGAVRCWGYNQWGQVGDGTIIARHTPVPVSGLSSAVGAIAVGFEHTCALVGSGVRCWGINFFGQLGDNSNTQRLTPVPVTGLSSGAEAVTAGGSHTCASLSSGAAKCWGQNSYGQLGDGTIDDRRTPVTVSSLGNGTALIAAGGSHTCALTAAGGIKCWGNNWHGQLGDGLGAVYTPVSVFSLNSGASAITAGGRHTCVRLSNGTARCWGQNTYGQMGDGTTIEGRLPHAVSGLGNTVSALAAGGYHTCALAGGAAHCWGLNSDGQLGDGTTNDSAVPVEVSSLGSGVDGLSAGAGHTCARSNSGAQCWGYNQWGQLGNGTTNGQLTPVPVSDLSSNISDMAAGANHTCALVGGGVRCWGSNDNGQLGDGTTTQRLKPVQVSTLASGVSAIAAGNDHTCALTAGGGVKCWGDNSKGQLGDNSTTDRHAPVQVSGLNSGVSAIAAGEFHTCALLNSGAVQCWGQNTWCQLGDGTFDDHLTPVDVVGLGSNVQAIAAGGLHSCALTTGGGVLCWGSNWNGQLGNGGASHNTVPLNIAGLQGKPLYLPLLER